MYFTVYYAAMAALPPVAGWLLDRVGDPRAPLIFGAVVMASTALFLVLFRSRAIVHGRTTVAGA